MEGEGRREGRGAKGEPGMRWGALPWGAGWRMELGTVDASRNWKGSRGWMATERTVRGWMREGKGVEGNRRGGFGVDY